MKSAADRADELMKKINDAFQNVADKRASLREKIVHGIRYRYLSLPVEYPDGLKRKMILIVKYFRAKSLSFHRPAP
ncbi:hypothetical protein LMG33818_000089 [Halomonadaceae bacterium LMG 33818]